MPLTISHPAASIPFAKMGLPLSALVIGSMMPDLPYYVFLYSLDTFSHSLPGLALFCLPAGLFSLVIFHKVLKFPAFSLLPYPLQQRAVRHLTSFSFFPAKHLMVILLSIIIGAFSHDAWDSFTHAYGLVVRHYPFLQTTLFHIGPHPVPLYELLQQLSSIIGIVLIIIWTLHWFKQSTPTEIPSSRTATVPNKKNLIPAMCLIAFCTAVTTGILVIFLLPLPIYQRWSYFLGHLFIVSTSVMLIELIFYSLLWNTLEKFGKKL
jgi:hypothetical protein